ncbi:MAG: VCBS repeat-containing protein [Balneolaceae bacterium]|nr:VCBS repeat-containing protein [Balneolaceae bacterium]
MRLVLWFFSLLTFCFTITPSFLLHAQSGKITNQLDDMNVLERELGNTGLAAGEQAGMSPKIENGVMMQSPGYNYDGQFLSFESAQDWFNGENPVPEYNISPTFRYFRIGDVNGDGRDDIFQSAFAWDRSGQQGKIKKTYLFFWGSMEQQPNQILTHLFLRPVGDLNGDGFDDAAARSDGTLYLGSEQGLQVESGANLLTHQVDFFQPFFDMDGDGIDDLVTFNHFTSTVTVQWGNTNPADITQTTFSLPKQSNTHMRPGDVNGVGTNELVVLQGYPEGNDPGQFYLFEFDGTRSINQLQAIDYPELIQFGDAYNQRLDLIDINGDGNLEIFTHEHLHRNPSPTNYVVTIDDATGLYENNTREFYTGPIVAIGDIDDDGRHDFFNWDRDNDMVYFSFGKQNLSDGLTYDDNSAFLEGYTHFINLTSSDHSDGGFGDFNGDGIDDFFTGIEKWGRPDERDMGRFYVAGTTNRNFTSQTVTYPLTGVFDRILATFNIGDINGDGTDDIAWSKFERGQVWIFYSGDTISDTPDLILDGAAEGMWLTYAVAAGDYNNDGHRDVAATYFGNYQGGTGGIQVYYGGENMDGRADHVITLADIYPDEGINLGMYWIITPGDINNDGADDLAFSNPFSWNGNGYENEVHILYGGSSFSATPDVTIDYKSEFGTGLIRAGHRMNGLGDVNGDGIEDFMVGLAWAPNEFENSSGQAWIYFGRDGSHDFAAPDLRLGFGAEGGRDQNRFGGGMAGGGDFNGDGFNDAAVQTWSSAEEANVRIYYGGKEMDGDPDARMTIPKEAMNPGSAPGKINQLAGSISFVSDHTGDGRDELLVTSGFSNQNSNAVLYAGSKKRWIDRPQVVFEAPNPFHDLGGGYHAAAGNFAGNGSTQFVLTQLGGDLDGNLVGQVHRFSLPELLGLKMIEDVAADQGGWVRVSIDGLLVDAQTNNDRIFDL